MTKVQIVLESCQAGQREKSVAAQDPSCRRDDKSANCARKLSGMPTGEICGHPKIPPVVGMTKVQIVFVLSIIWEIA
jgi:hypothetical protein